MPAPAYRLDRSIFIAARPATVFEFFQDSARWASWWGAGSTIEPRKGGKVYVRYPNAVEASGEVLEIIPPERIVFTYGYHTADSPVPAGNSRVRIELAGEASGTRLTLTHELPTEASRNEHVQGWRFQLSVFANVVSNVVLANVDAVADAWFAAWAEPDDQTRTSMLEAIAAPDVRFGDRYSLLEGIGEIAVHAGAAQRFMPGIRIRREGASRHTLGTALVEWLAPGPDGKALASGTNVFRFDADGRIREVVGLWR
jgi:uncharacterized protein YndB with AHSA1/START domain